MIAPTWSHPLVGGGKYTLDKPLVDFLRGLSPAVDVSALVEQVGTLAAQVAAIDTALPDTLKFLAGSSGSGLAVRKTNGSWTYRSIEGVTDRTTITNPAGEAGNPVVDIAATYVGQASITTLGTIGTGVWQGTPVEVAYLDPGAAGYVLTGNGPGVPPSYQEPAASAPPLTIAAGSTYTVPVNTQVLFSFPIAADGLLVVDGVLIEVH